MKVLLALPAVLGALALAAPAAAAGSPWDTTFSGDGRVTTDFGDNDAPNDVVVQPDGKIVAVGTRGGGFGAFAVARYNTDGSLDTSFSGDGKAESSGGFGTGSEAFAAALQPDGRIVVAGNVCGLFGCDFHLQRYDTNGSLDTTFNGNGTVGISVGGLRGDTALDVAVQSDGKIVAAGDTCEPANTSDCDGVVMRLEPNGTLDASFAGGIAVLPLPGGGSNLRAVGIQGDGTIVAAGTIDSDNVSPATILLARYGSDGTLLGTHTGRFHQNSSLDQVATALAIEPDDDIVVVGGETFLSFGVARFDSAGAPDSSFGFGGGDTTSFGGAIVLAGDVGLQPGGRIVVVGGQRILRYTSAGALDPSFDGDGRLFDADLGAGSVAIAPDGKIVVAGQRGGDFAVARLLADGGDGTPPVISPPATMTMEATGPAGAVVHYLVGVTDNEDPSPDLVCAPASGSTFPLGFTTVSCTATDDQGNGSTASFVVRVVDTAAPTILAGTIRMNADSAAGAVVNYLVGVKDAVDRSPSLNCQPPSGSVLPIGTTNVTCIATDASGNRSKRAFRVIVVGFRDQLGGLIDSIAGLPLTGRADLRRDNALQFCFNAFWSGYWASNTRPRTNDDGRFALLEIRQCVLYLEGPPAEVGAASATIRLALIDLVCRIAHMRYDEVSVAPGANASRLVQARTSLDQADAAPGTVGALFDCVDAWSILQSEPPQY